jgi:hypothetical protein
VCGCLKKAKVILRSEPPPPIVAVLMVLEYKGSDPAQAVYGEVTNTRYPFNLRRKLFVDTRDAVYLLGTDYDSC